MKALGLIVAALIGTVGSVDDGSVTVKLHGTSGKLKAGDRVRVSVLPAQAAGKTKKRRQKPILDDRAFYGAALAPQLHGMQPSNRLFSRENPS